MLMARSGHQVHLFAPPPLNAKPWAGIVAPADRMQRRMTPRWPFGALARPAWLAIVGIRGSPGGLSSARRHWSAMASLVLPDEDEAYAQENSHPNRIIRASKQSAPLSSPRL
jgi:hypothetical protein